MPRLAFEPARRLLNEGETATYTVALDTRWLGAEVTIAISSDNPDVTVSPSSVSISQHDWSARTITVTAAHDADDADDFATLQHAASGGHFNNVGGRVRIEVSDDDDNTPTPTPTPPPPPPGLPTVAATYTIEVPVGGHTITITREAGSLAGVTLALPVNLDRSPRITLAPAGDHIPRISARFGLGADAAAQALVVITVVNAPTDGLTICLPVSDDLATEAGDRPLTLARYAGGAIGWVAVSDTELREMEMQVCAAGQTAIGTFAVAYTLPQLGPASNLTVAAGDAVGTLVLRWTAGANATRHWVAGIKQSDWDAGDFSNLIWTAASGTDMHTVSGLDSGAEYVFAVAAGRGSEWSGWTALVRGVVE